MKIRHVGAELLHEEVQADTQTDVTKPTAAFRNFARAPSNELEVVFPATVRNK